METSNHGRTQMPATNVADRAAIRPFRIDIPQAALDDLSERLARLGGEAQRIPPVHHDD